MRRYRVKWIEYHEQEIVARTDEDLLMQADVNSYADTYKLCRLEDIEDLGPEPQDEMDAAHSKKEE